MPEPDGEEARPALPPDLTSAEFDEQIARAGFELTTTERASVLGIAQYLCRSLGLVRSYNSLASGAD